MAQPTDELLLSEIRAILLKGKIEDLTVKLVLTKLQDCFGCDLTDRKAWVRESLTTIINEANSDEEEEEAVEATKKKEGGFAKEYNLSAPLAVVCEKSVSSRTEITKLLWVYIRKNNLQNPTDKRQILCDDNFQKIFKRKKVTMFKMAALLTDNLYEIEDSEESDSEEEDTPTKKKIKAEKTKSKPAKATKAGAKVTKEKKPRKPKDPNAPNRASRNVLSATLSEICQGEKALSRFEVTSALWCYIRAHNLQNPAKKSEIVCDALFQKAMGGNEMVTMYSMNTHVGAHLGEKVETPEAGWPKIPFLEEAKEAKAAAKEAKAAAKVAKEEG